MLKVLVEPGGQLDTILICEVHHVPPVLLPEPVPVVGNPGPLAQGPLTHPLQSGGVRGADLLVEADDAVIDSINDRLVVGVVRVREVLVMLMPVKCRHMQDHAHCQGVVGAFLLAFALHGVPDSPDPLNEQILGFGGHILDAGVTG